MKLFFLSFFCFSLTLFLLNTFVIPKEHFEFEHAVEVIQSRPDILDSETAIPPLQTALEEPKIEEKIEKTNNVIFRYEPDSFQELAEQTFKKAIQQSLDSSIFSSKIEDMVIIFYQEENRVRGNLKNKILRLYESDRIGDNETFAVFLHELAHYIDLYYFKKKDDYDSSHEFYTISWLNTKVSRAGQTEKDFVSGYASTNAYEDFSESFLYFVLHNTQFQEKAQKNENLQKKYDFFANGLFTDREFQGSDFSSNLHEDYHRDVTKLDFSLENFLDYLKKSI